ncbi:MAG: insulinase family protein [Phycisphaerales bacterium]|nr:insulinase family protein [Phycisphaerales bacterium]
MNLPTIQQSYNTARAVLAGALAMMFPALAAGAAPQSVDHPSKLAFPPLEFEPPSPAQFRHELTNGVPVYLAVSKEFPLVTIRFTFKGGQYMEPTGKEGLAQLTGACIRQGGTQSLSGRELDEQFDFLAANVFSAMTQTTSNAQINCLTSNLDEAFALFMDMVRTPGFDPERVETFRAQAIEQMKTRNDMPLAIAIRELNNLAFGNDHFEGKMPTGQSIESITIDDMRDLHERIFNPANLIISVVGDFDEAQMMSRLESALAGWSRGASAPEVPAPTDALAPALYHTEKDAPQGQILIAQRGLTRDDPDAIKVAVMNQILGGGGFTSRIMNRVRTQEGLAYTAGSTFSDRVDYPGLFLAYCFSKTDSVALATRLIFEEIERIRTEPVTDEELQTVKNEFIQTFPRRFESKTGTLVTFVNDEITGRDPNFWRTYRDKVNAVTRDDVMRMAQKHLRPEDMLILLVGKWDEIKKGNVDTEDDANRVTTTDYFFDGRSTMIPEKDPLTLEPK